MYVHFIIKYLVGWPSKSHFSEQFLDMGHADLQITAVLTFAVNAETSDHSVLSFHGTLHPSYSCVQVCWLFVLTDSRQRSNR